MLLKKILLKYNSFFYYYFLIKFGERIINKNLKYSLIRKNKFQIKFSSVLPLIIQ